jgi:diadenosine tetraphosphate (Ap4A) HIT family hydrolase
MTDTNRLFEMTHTRVQAQKDRMEECASLGICPFCWEHLEKYHDAPVIRKGEFWAITANDHPYNGARHHYLAIFKDHINSLAYLCPAACHELFLFFHELALAKDMRGSSILMRSGEMLYTGATVHHLHAHIISGASREEISEIKYPDSFITSVLGYKTPGSR